jgi:LysM repeat protein
MMQEPEHQQTTFSQEEKMNSKRFLGVFVMIILVFGLTACELSASTPPPTLSSEADMATLQSKFVEIATQTAAAGGAIIPLPTATVPLPAAPTMALPTLLPTVAPTTVPSTPVPVLVFTATPGIPTSYVLQKGEHAYCLARRFNVNPGDLLTLNGLSAASVLQPGMSLKIPQTGSFPGTRALRSHPTTYTVAAGDTIYTVACKYGDVDPNALAQVNNLAAPYTLTAGQTLNIP